MQSTGVIRWTGGMSPPSPRSFRTQIGGRADWKGWKPERLSGMQRLRLPVGPSVWTVWFGRFWFGLDDSGRSDGIGSVRCGDFGGGVRFRLGPACVRKAHEIELQLSEWMSEWVVSDACWLEGVHRWGGMAVEGRGRWQGGRSVGGGAEGRVGVSRKWTPCWPPYWAAVHTHLLANLPVFVCTKTCMCSTLSEKA